MKYLITGGKGFIGSNLVEELQKNPDNTVMLYPYWLNGQDI